MAPLAKEIIASIERGTVFFYWDNIANRDGSNSKKQRYFIVLNSSPKTDDFIVLATVTSKIAGRLEFVKKISGDTSTLVFITPTDFPRLTVPSVINCNQVYPVTLKNLIKKVGNGGIMFPEKIPKLIMSAIISGVMKSNQVEGEYKSIIL
jgi:hypothetical protein